jgi:hypothetical protein
MVQNQRPALVVPVLLIVVGAIFLYANYRPTFDPWPILKTYWPLILIFVGLGKMWDATRQRENPGATRGSSMGSTIAVLAFVLVLVLLLWHGRAFSRERRFPMMQHQFRTVDRQNAQTVHASLEAAAGQLTISAGARHLLEADFTYSDSYVNPRVDYRVANGVGQLAISQEDQSTHFGVSHNEWNVRFSDEVPLELKVEMGAGQGHLRLRDLPLTRLNLEMGAGQVEVDLTGERKKDLDADLEGGVGQASIRLPKNVGVIVHASGGIGTIDARGLKRDGDEYVNDAYGKTPATIHLKVTGGIGEISLVQEP